LHYFCSNETAVSETAVSEIAIKKDKDMRFFDRTEEIASLRKIREMAKNNAQFTVVTGRRRIGKTSLVWKAYEDEPILYFFVARKAEGDLCEDYRL
jgi:AAA+ ATPase superfamily predicted ATPase